MIKEETTLIPTMLVIANARRARREEMMQQSKGKIDVQMAEQFLSDHFDSFEKERAISRMNALSAATSTPRRAA